MICQGAKVGVTTQSMDVSDVCGIISVRSCFQKIKACSLQRCTGETWQLFVHGNYLLCYTSLFFFVIHCSFCSSLIWSKCAFSHSLPCLLSRRPQDSDDVHVSWPASASDTECPQQRIQPAACTYTQCTAILNVWVLVYVYNVTVAI